MAKDTQTGFWKRLFSKSDTTPSPETDDCDGCEQRDLPEDTSEFESFSARRSIISVPVPINCDDVHRSFGAQMPPTVCHPVEGVTGQKYDRLEDAAMDVARYIFKMAEPLGYEWGCVFAEDPDGKVIPSVLVTQNKIGGMGSAIGNLEIMMTLPVLGALHSHPGRHGQTYKTNGPSSADKANAYRFAEYYKRPYRVITVDYPTGAVKMYVGKASEVWVPGPQGMYVPVGTASPDLEIGNVKETKPPVAMV